MADQSSEPESSPPAAAGNPAVRGGDDRAGCGGDDPAGPLRDDSPVLPRGSRDESSEGWGERPPAGDSDDERYFRERPPHHEG